MITEVQELVDKGEICLSNAYLLTTVSEEDQMKLLEYAKKENPKDFKERIREHRTSSTTRDRR